MADDDKHLMTSSRTRLSYAQMTRLPEFEFHNPLATGSFFFMFYRKLDNGQIYTIF